MTEASTTMISVGLCILYVLAGITVAALMDKQGSLDWADGNFGSPTKGMGVTLIAAFWPFVIPWVLGALYFNFLRSTVIK